MLNHNVCKSDPGVRGTDSHSTFFLVIPLCFYWYHRQDAPTFHQLIGMPYFLSKFLKISPGAGPGLRSWCGLGGPGHWRQQTESAEPARHPLPAGLLCPWGCEGSSKQPWEGLGNLSSASYARPRGVCFSHGPREVGF